jgi:hypothetical protein
MLRRFSNIFTGEFIPAIGGVTRVIQRLFPGEGRGPEQSRRRLLNRTVRTCLNRSALESFPEASAARALRRGTKTAAAGAGFRFFNTVKFVKFIMEGAE